VASWIYSPLGATAFSSQENVEAGTGAAQTPFQWVSGLKRLEREADCASFSNARVKNEWSYTSSPPICLLKRQISPDLKEAVSGPNNKLFSLTPLRGDSSVEKN
jgi:hypothetical protein